LIHLFGRIDEVYCLSHRRVMARLEDTTTVLFGLADGMSATLYCSTHPLSFRTAARQCALHL
jgi:hypothetical protein